MRIRRPRVPARTVHGVARPLTGREREVLIAMIERGAETGDESSATADRRADWRQQVDELRVGRMCGCGACPTIVLEAAGGPASGFSERIVLEADVEGAGLLLFIDDDRVSELELYPTWDESFDTFPSVESIRF